MFDPVACSFCLIHAYPCYCYTADRMQTSEDGAMGIMKGMMHSEAESGVHYGPATTKGACREVVRLH